MTSINSSGSAQAALKAAQEKLAADQAAKAAADIIKADQQAVAVANRQASTPQTSSATSTALVDISA